MKSTNRLIVSILIVAAVAIGFWVVLLSPKREEADKLSGELDALKVTLAQADSTVLAAEAAKREFPANYRQLVVMGGAVPEGDETASLLVELNRLAKRAKISFETLLLTEGGAAAPAEVAPAPPPVEAAPTEPGSAVPASATVPPTEAAASLMPLGASIGPAGLAVMPYTLTFSGDFFQIANFIGKVDALVETKNAKVGVDGRLVTIGGFSLAPNEETDRLSATFVVTTYVTPPNQGITAGASPTEPEATPTSTEPEESTEASEAGEAQ